MKKQQPQEAVGRCCHQVPFFVRDDGALLSLLVRHHGVVVRHRAGLIVDLILGFWACVGGARL